MIRTIPSTFDFFNFLSKLFSKILYVLGLLKISKFDYFQNQSKWSPNGPKTPGIELSTGFRAQRGITALLPTHSHSGNVMTQRGSY